MREVAAQPLAREVVVGRDLLGRVQVSALVHDGVRDAREWLGLVGLARIVRGLEGASLHPGEGHGFARAARGRLVRGVVHAQEAAGREQARFTRYVVCATRSVVHPRS